MIRNRQGFTLVEMIVVMAVFITVLAISASSFNTILVHSSKLVRSEESNIEGVIGLEMFRHDLQQAGFGLFTEASIYDNEAAETQAALYNDAPNNAPRPIVAGNNLASASFGSMSILAGSDYVAIKGTTVGREKTAQKWTFLKFSSGSVKPHIWSSAAERLTSSPDSEKVVVIQKQFGTSIRSSLVRDTSNNFYYSYSDTGFGNLSSSSNGIYTVYGVDKANSLRFPFNRSDYFVARPATTATIPTYCAPNTGILYKTTIDHGGGSTPIPILDCVLDLQVVLGWDVNNDGVIDTWSNANGSVVSGVGSATDIGNALNTTNNNDISSVPNIRNSLKIIKVYIIAQNGKRDSSFTSTSPLMVGETGEESLTRPSGLTLATDQLNYHWKLYRIVVRPKNLLSNQ